MAEHDLDSNFIPALHKPPALLPIAKHKESLLYTIETYPVTIVIGQTGSGKTTQIPQFLEKAGWCNSGRIIGVTQVRLQHQTRVTIANAPKCSQDASQLQQLLCASQMRSDARLAKKWDIRYASRM